MLYSILNKKEQWDYICLRPCAINDPAQVWYYKEGGFYSKIGDYRIKDYKYYLYISQNKQDYYNHNLTSDMREWVTTKARVHSLNLKTTLAWYCNDTKTYIGEEMKASNEPRYFFYNPENKHFFTYDQVNGDLQCLFLIQKR